MYRLMFAFDNSYSRLADTFFQHINPTPVSNPSLIKVNEPLGRQLGVDADFLSSPLAKDIFAGNEIAQGSTPIAMVYAAHQFGGWVPQLGDGRAVLLGEVIDSTGIRQDIQLKGAGRTLFSRSGDGRAAIGPILREYVVSEAMAALNIPTTRALCAVLTGETVYRERPVPGAIITRVSSSHIRVGTFQYFDAKGDLTSLKTLADYVIDRHFPFLKETTNPYLGLLDNMISKQASLIAKWMGVGFVHGVMNTDNTLISGETLDYGPCAFLDTYDPDTVFSSIDRNGRYSYANQPYIGQCNATYFASSILSLISTDENEARELATNALDSYQDEYIKAWSAELNAKLGLTTAQAGDTELGQNLLDCMTDNQLDFTETFRMLSNLTNQSTADDNPVLYNWLAQWRKRLELEKRSDTERQQAMRAKNPAYIPRNHQIEAMITNALEGDYSTFETLLDVLAKPFEERDAYEEFQQPPLPSNNRYRTFCGT